MTKGQRTVSRASLTIIAAVLAVFAVIFGVLGFIAVGTEQALAARGLEISEETVKQKWDFGRAWLHKELNEELSSSP